MAKEQLSKQARFKVELYRMIFDLTSEEFHWLTPDQQLKITSDVYNTWSFEDINITLEAINENLCK